LFVHRNVVTVMSPGRNVTWPKRPDRNSSDQNGSDQNNPDRNG